MVRYTNREYANMWFVYAQCNGNARLAAREYAQAYPLLRHPAPNTFARLEARMAVDGARLVPRVYPRPRDARVDDIVAYFEAQPHASQRTASAELGIRRSTLQRVMKDESFHPFKVILDQGLTDEDPARRLAYCRWLTDMPAAADFASNVLWTDEATFNNRANVNRHNCHYWARETPHWLRTVDHQQQWSVNCWGGILGNQVIGPHFFEGRLNAARYLQFLQDELEYLLDDVPLAQRRDHWFQQDGAPPHFGINVRNHLDQRYPQHWIGRAGPVAWPPRSPDLTPLDFFLWGP
ncbi:hypothetical protein FOCC_FOCC008349 [Frankliniella occidentalis]|nr:hypothetical protein FOCC_FOCC008349 [Frankliniella occidentalis]